MGVVVVVVVAAVGRCDEGDLWRGWCFLVCRIAGIGASSITVVHSNIHSSCLSIHGHDEWLVRLYNIQTGCARS